MLPLFPSIIQQPINLHVFIIVVVANFVMVSIQSSHTSPSKCRCSSPSRNLMSCSLLTPYSLSCFSCGDVICGISCLCSFGYFSCGDVICDITIICLITCNTNGTTMIIVGTVDGFTLPLIIFFTFKVVFSYSLFIHEHEVPFSSTLFFLLRALLRKSIVIFFLFSNVVYISSLVFLTLVDCFCGLSF